MTDIVFWCLGRIYCFHAVGAGSGLELSSKKTPPSRCFTGFVGGQIPVILPLTTHQVTNTSPVTSHWAVSVMTVKSALKCRCKDHPASSPLICPIFSYILFLPFLFQNGVVHRDLKLENILLDDNFNIKVGFFLSSSQNGFACFVTFLSKVLEEPVLWQQLLSNSIWQEAQGFGGWGKSTTGDESDTLTETVQNLGDEALSFHPKTTILQAASIYWWKQQHVLCKLVYFTNGIIADCCWG